MYHSFFQNNWWVNRWRDLFADFNSAEFGDLAEIAVKVQPFLTSGNVHEHRKQFFEDIELPEEIQELWLFWDLTIPTKVDPNFTQVMLDTIRKSSYTLLDTDKMKWKKSKQAFENAILTNKKGVFSSLAKFRLDKSIGIAIDLSPSIANFNILYRDILIRILDYLFHFGPYLDQAEEIGVAIGWYKRKYISDIEDKDIQFYQRAEIDILDIFFLHYQDGKFFWNIPKEVFQEFIELTLLKQALFWSLYSSREKRGVWEEESAKMAEWLYYLIQRIQKYDQTEECLRQITQLATHWEVSIKSLRRYHNSSMPLVIDSGSATIKQWSRTQERQIPDDKMKLIVACMFHWDGFLFQQAKKAFPNFFLTLIDNPDINERRISAIWKLLDADHIHDWNQWNLIILVTLWLENHAYIDSLTEKDIATLWSRFINATSWKTPRKLFDMSYLTDLNYDDFQTVLWLDDRCHRELSDFPEKTQELIASSRIIDMLRLDIEYLHASHPLYTSLKILSEDFHPLEGSSRALAKDINRIYKQGEIALYCSLNRRLMAMQQWESQQEQKRSINRLHLALDRNGINSTEKFLLDLFSLDTNLRNQYISYLETWESARDALLSVSGHLEKLWKYLSKHIFWEDIGFWVEAFLDESTDLEVESVQVVEIEMSLEEEFIAVYGNEFWRRLYILWFPEEMMKKLIHFGTHLSGNFQQTFVIFIENFQEDILKLYDTENLSEKISFSQSVLELLKSLKVFHLDKPEKLFEFIFLKDISKSDIDSLTSYIRDSIDSGRKYMELLGEIMHFLKHKSYISSTLENSTENLEGSQTQQESSQNRRRRKMKSARLYRWERQSNNSLVFWDERSKQIHTRLLERRSTLWLFQELSREIIASMIVYDPKVYIVILSSLSEENIHFSQEETSKLITKFLKAPWALSSRDIARLMKPLQVWWFKEHTSAILHFLSFKIEKSPSVFSAEDFAQIIFHLQNVEIEYKVQVSSIIEALLKKVDINKLNMDGQDIYMTLYGLLSFWDIPVIHQLQEKVFWKVAKLQQVDVVEAISLKRIYAFYQKDTPEKIESEYHKAREYYSQEETSFAESYLFSNIQAEFPDAVQWMFIDWVECDIYLEIGNRKINIEWDGKSHNRIKKFRDAKRDSFLKTVHGISTFRMTAPDGELQQTTQKVVNALLALKNKTKK